MQHKSKLDEKRRLGLLSRQQPKQTTASFARTQDQLTSRSKNGYEFGDSKPIISESNAQPRGSDPRDYEKSGKNPTLSDVAAMATADNLREEVAQLKEKVAEKDNKLEYALRMRRQWKVYQEEKGEQLAADTKRIHDLEEVVREQEEQLKQKSEDNSVFKMKFDVDEKNKTIFRKAIKETVCGLKEEIVRQEEMNARLTQENTALKL